jgi:hypothetical protein
MNNNFKYQHSQVLQLIYEINKANLITDQEKRQMKGK